jgi:hypothetical protein
LKEMGVIPVAVQSECSSPAPVPGRVAPCEFRRTTIFTGPSTGFEFNCMTQNRRLRCNECATRSCVNHCEARHAPQLHPL